MFLSFLFLTFMSGVTSGFLGRYIGVTGAHVLSVLCLASSAILSTLCLYEVALCNSPVTVDLGTWIEIGYFHVTWSFLFDTLSISLLSCVLIVSTFVHLFSVDYLSHDPHQQRFMSYLSFFTFFMLILVAGNNYLVLFVGWEGIGVFSYFLINFWFTRVQANKAAIKALTVNRVGDWFLSVFFFIAIISFGSLDYSIIFSLTPLMSDNIITFLALLALLGSSAKSAQLFLSIWLPASMEGPTPVSSLIHAATLVCSGVYLLIRTSPLLEYSDTTLLITLWIGALTALLAASVGLLQNDIKKIIAFSTISQLGYCYVAIGLSAHNLALFHLINHAMFKSLLFLSAGAVIHAMNDVQDIRKYGGLVHFIPMTYIAMLVGSLSLIAFPAMTGYYSKELIINMSGSVYLFEYNLIYWITAIVAGLTAFYSFRLISLTFFESPKGSKQLYNNIHESKWQVIVPFLGLGSLAIFLGYIGSDAFVGMGTSFFENSIYIHPSHEKLINTEFALTSLDKNLASIFSLGGALLAIYLYNFQPLALIQMKQVFRPAYVFLNGFWNMDVLFVKGIIQPAMNWGLIFSKVLDRGILESLGPRGLALNLDSSADKLMVINKGTAGQYGLAIFASMIVLLGLMLPLIWLSVKLLLLLLLTSFIVLFLA